MTTKPDTLNPLAYLGQYFRDSQLQRAMEIVIAPGQGNGKIEEALELVHSAEENNSNVDIGVLKPCQDSTSRWWASVIAGACHLMQEEYEEATKLYQVIESIPDDENPLFESVVSCFESQKIVLEAFSNEDETENEENDVFAISQILSTFDIATLRLEEAIEHSMTLEGNELTIARNALLLCCDWNMDARTFLWQRKVASNCRVSSNYLTSFQRDLNSLRRLAHKWAWAAPRVALREATMRMMAGAAPGATQRLLDQSMAQRGTNKSLICTKDNKMVVTGEREKATALLMACKHLPPQLLSSPGEKAGMLTEAAKTLDKIGDKRGRQQCYKLMKNLGTSVQAG